MKIKKKQKNENDGTSGQFTNEREMQKHLKSQNQARKCRKYGHKRVMQKVRGTNWP